MLTDLLIGNKNRQLLAGLFMMIISLGVIFDNRNGYSLREKYAAAKYIQNQSAGRPVQIVFDMDYRERFGWDYLFQYFKIEQSSCCEQVHLIYPALPWTPVSARFGSLGVFSQNFIEYNKNTL